MDTANLSNPGLMDHEPLIDMPRLRDYRYSRVQHFLRSRDYAGCLLYDPINIRYATGTRNMTIWTMHNAARYCFVPAEGRAILFEPPKCEHISAGIETIGEIRPAIGWYYYYVTSRMPERIAEWADEIVSLTWKHGG